MRILVRTPNWIGDQILAYPFFHYLREAYPGAHITAACVPWVASLQFMNLVDDVCILPAPLEKSFRARLDNLGICARILKGMGPWDLGICLPNSFSSAWILFRSGVKVRRGYRSDGRGALLNQAIPWEQAASLHRAEAYAALVTELKAPPCSVTEFWGVPPENDLDPGTPPVTRFDPCGSWPDAEALEPPEGDYWVLAPGSTAESRRWPGESFAALARKIADEKGWKGVIVGGLAEQEIAATLVARPDLNVVDYVGRSSVAGLWKLFSRAKFTVSNDSGLAHVAALCGSPVQVAWGGGDPKRTEPLGPGRVRVMFNPVDCWPCERNTCSQPPGQKLRCLRGVGADSLWEEIKVGIRP